MRKNMNVAVQVKNKSKFPLPEYASQGSSGVDLMADEGAFIEPGEMKMIVTNLHVAIPVGWEIQIRSRSGLAYKKQVFVLNSPGTIDADYRGSCNVLLYNAGTEVFHVEEGDRIAQAVLVPVCHIQWDEVDELPDTSRGEGGFGSTGV